MVLQLIQCQISKLVECTCGPIYYVLVKMDTHTRGAVLDDM